MGSGLGNSESNSGSRLIGNALVGYALRAGNDSIRTRQCRNRGGAVPALSFVSPMGVMRERPVPWLVVLLYSGFTLRQDKLGVKDTRGGFGRAVLIDPVFDIPASVEFKAATFDRDLTRRNVFGQTLSG